MNDLSPMGVSDVRAARDGSHTSLSVCLSEVFDASFGMVLD
jgi:hypothetical protein